MREQVELEEGSSSMQRTAEKMIEAPILCFQRRVRMILFVLLLSWRLRPLRIPSLDHDYDDHDGDGDGDYGDDNDIEAGSAPCCRICLECNREDDDKLISPCMCKGTLQFVHRSCLDHWRSVKEGFDFSHCRTCKAQYHFRIGSSENSWHKLKFRLFVTRDVLLVFLAVQTVIAATGAYAYFMKLFTDVDRWNHILSKHPIPFYYCVGVAMVKAYGSSTVGVVPLIVTVGFCGLILHCFKLNRRHPEFRCCQCCCCGGGIIGCCFGPAEGYCYVLVIVFCIIFGILGIAYGFIAATMILQRFWQKHYHILTKRELTKQYIVEDLHGGCYTPPKLDPKHKKRLLTLNLF